MWEPGARACQACPQRATARRYWQATSNGHKMRKFSQSWQCNRQHGRESPVLDLTRVSPLTMFGSHEMDSSGPLVPRAWKLHTTASSPALLSRKQKQRQPRPAGTAPSLHAPAPTGTTQGPSMHSSPLPHQLLPAPAPHGMSHMPASVPIRSIFEWNTTPSMVA